MKYSVNGGNKTPVTGAITVSAGDKVSFYGNGTSIANYNGTKIQGCSAQVKAYGNIMSLVDEENFATATALPNQEYVFYGFFQQNSNLIDASGLLLPATTLASSCYTSMFAYCTNMTGGTPRAGLRS